MGGGASSMQHRLHKLSADSVQQLVEGIGPSFVEIAKQLRENGLDGEYLESASDEDEAALYKAMKAQQKKLNSRAPPRAAAAALRRRARLASSRRSACRARGRSCTARRSRTRPGTSGAW